MEHAQTCTGFFQLEVCLSFKFHVQENIYWPTILIFPDCIYGSSSYIATLHGSIDSTTAFFS